MKKFSFTSALIAASSFFAGGHAMAQYQAAVGIDAFTLNEYWDSQLHEYGTAVTWSVSNGGSYAGIESGITSLSGTSSQTGTNVQRDPIIAARYAPLKTATYIPFLGTNAKIVDGTNSSGSSVTVSMAWRNRTDIEYDNRGYPGIELQRPPMAFDSYNMISDAVSLNNTPGIYVLEFEYDEGQFVFDPGRNEQNLAEEGWIYLGWFEDPANAGGGNVPTQEWVNAVDGNTTTGASAVTNYQGSYADFLADVAHPDAGNLALTVGTWGVDINDNTVFAILDHNSEFIVVPEPSSLVPLSMACLLIMRRRARR